MGGGGPNGGGGIGGIGAYMNQGVPQAPTGFGGGIAMPGNQPAWGTGMSGGNWGVTPGIGLRPYMGGLQQYGLMLNNPQFLSALSSLLGGGFGHTGGPPHTMMAGGPNHR